MDIHMSNRLVEAFAALRAAGKQTLLPFITAGYPDLAATEALLMEFERRGIHVCELGIPFSDPIADGAVIQASYTQALAAGVCSKGIFEMVARYRAAGGKMALAAMVSYSIIFRHGVAQYLQQARAAGFDAMIIPDLPLDEADKIAPLAEQAGLANILLISPTTPAARRLEIAAHSRGFIYYMSIAGITGERDRLPPATIAAVAELRRHTQTPVCVGFGISNAATVAEVCKAADGAIVGSAIVHRITDAVKAGLSREAMVQQVGAFVGELLAPVK
jgi:tryptophan synthase alpha chain